MNTFISEDEFSDEENSEPKVWRICFTEATKENKLISVCKCSGSMKYIHHQWLKGWINSKRTVKFSPQCLLYYWKTLEWELWKTTYSEQLQSKFELVNYEWPFPNFMALECINWNGSKTVHVLNLSGDKNKYKIGRGHDNDIRISDISVSRFHAFISKEGKNFILKDNRSKFGTLVLVKKPMLLSWYPAIHLQAGRTLMQIYMKDKSEWSISGWLCFNQKIPNHFEPMYKYLSFSETPDNCIPQEFKLHWKKETQCENIMVKRAWTLQISNKNIDEQEISDLVPEDPPQAVEITVPAESLPNYSEEISSFDLVHNVRESF